MTSFPGEHFAAKWLRPSGSLSSAAHFGYAASLLLHIGLGTIALLIAVVTALNDNLATNERLDVNDTQLGFAVLLWVVALAAIGVLWARRSPWGWLAPLIWALIGLPLTVTHAQVEPIPPLGACATAGRMTVGFEAASGPPPVAWCHETDGTIHDVTAIDETVYLASISGALTALNTRSGEIQWESAGDAASAALVAGPEMVVGGGVAAVTAWSPAGREIWSTPTPGPVSALAMNDAHQVFVACADGTILALDGATGSALWQSLVPVIDANLIVSGREVYAYSAAREITIAVLDAASGEVGSAWIYDLGPRTVLTPPVVAGTTLVAGYEILADGGSPSAGGVIGMDPATGAINWDRPLDAPVQVAPVNVNGVAHVLSLNGHIYRLEPLSGQDVRPLEIIESRARGDRDANRLLSTDGGSVYISQRGAGATAGSAYNGVVTATDETGAALWRFRLSDAPSLPVTRSGDVVFVPDGRAIFAVLAPAQAMPAATPVQ